MHESFFLSDFLQRLRAGFDSKYTKVTNLNNAKAMVESLPNLVNEERVWDNPDDMALKDKLADQSRAWRGQRGA